jgi:hypothetical protein
MRLKHYFGDSYSTFDFNSLCNCEHGKKVERVMVLKRHFIYQIRCCHYDGDEFTFTLSTNKAFVVTLKDVIRSLSYGYELFEINDDDEIDFARFYYNWRNRRICFCRSSCGNCTCRVGWRDNGWNAVWCECIENDNGDIHVEDVKAFKSAYGDYAYGSDSE